MTPEAFDKLNDKYQAAHHRVMVALGKIETKIHDMPAPGSKRLGWGNLGDMLHLAEQLEILAGEEPEIVNP